MKGIWIEHRAERNKLVAVLLVVTISIVLSVMLANSGEWFVLFLLVMILFAIMLLPWLTRRQGDIVGPINFVLITYFGYVSSGLYAVFGRSIKILGYENVESQEAYVYLALALCYASIGLLAFYAGYYGGKRQVSLVELIPLRVHNDRHALEEFRRVRWAIIVASALGLLGYVVFINSAGGLLEYWLHINRRTVVGTSRYSLALFQLLPVASLFFYAYSLRLGRLQVWSYAHLFVTSVVQLSLGARLPAVFLWVSAFTIWWFVGKRKRIPAVRLLVVIALGVVLFVCVRAYRYTGVGLGRLDFAESISELSSYLTVNGIVVNTVGTRDYTDINIFAHIIAVTPSKVPYQLGKSFIALPAYIVPRIVWPDKPHHLDVYLYDQLISSNVTTLTSVPVGLVAELYINFHILGIIIGMFIFGRVACQLNDFLTRQVHKDSTSGIVLYSLLCTNLLMHMTRSGFDRAVTSVIVVVVIWGVFASMTRHTHTATL